MDEFGQHVQEWQVFYATLAAACATLTGLLFVSLSLIMDSNSRTDEEFMRIAREAFANFLYVLSVSLVFLVPRQVPVGLGLALFILGSFGLFSVARSLRETLQVTGRSASAGRVVRTVGLSAAAYFGLVVVAIAIVSANTDALYWLVIVMTALLVSASRNAWYLLVSARRKA